MQTNCKDQDACQQIEDLVMRVTVPSKFIGGTIKFPQNNVWETPSCAENILQKY